MDYLTLRGHLTNYLHRSDLVDQVPVFLLLCQAKLSKRVRTPDLHTKTTLNVTAGETDVALPSDYLEAKRVTIPYSGGILSLNQNSLEQNAQILFDRGGSTATPSHYAIYSTYLELAPTPAEDITLTLIYKAKLAAFSADGDTDAILTKFPEAYIYGVMFEAATYVRDIKKVATWGVMFDAAIDAINKAGSHSEWSGGPLRIMNHQDWRP